MAKNWYPIINQAACINCETCVNFCPRKVYEAGIQYPEVVQPDACVEFCRGCAKICPTGAITFFGDQAS